jgi:putative aldouronate transport system permease protein
MGNAEATGPSRSTRRRWKRPDPLGFLRDIRMNPFSYLLVLPALIYITVYGYFTWPYIVIAFERFSPLLGIFRSPFVGLSNFEFFFRSSNAFIVTRNTLFLNLIYMVAKTVFSLTMALLVNEVVGRYKKTVKTSQSLMLLPYFLSWVVISYIVYSFLSTRVGFVNTLLVDFGFKPINWYSSPKYWPAILTLVKVWKNVGVDMIIYLAVITGFDAQIYEAAAIDGASRMQRARYVILPMLVPTISILFLLSVGRIFFGDFGMVYALIKDNGMLYSTTDVIDTYVFRAMRVNGDISQATAVGIYQSFMGLVFITVANRIVRKLYPEGSLF